MNLSNDRDLSLISSLLLYQDNMFLQTAVISERLVIHFQTTHAIFKTYIINILTASLFGSIFSVYFTHSTGHFDPHIFV